MVPETMKIVWDNSPHRGFHGTYRILFTDDGSRADEIAKNRPHDPHLYLSMIGVNP
jgi:hypothetical protein